MMAFPSNSKISRILRSGVVFSRHARRALATLFVLGLTACAVTPATPDAKQAAVRERAVAKWEAMVKDDLDAAYRYMSPASRQVVSLDKYKANTRRNAFRAAQIDAVQCEGDACIVKLTVTYDHKLMKGIVTPVSEAWVFDDGQSWFAYRE